jgi:hypothetical protein
MYNTDRIDGSKYGIVQDGHEDPVFVHGIEMIQ